VALYYDLYLRCPACLLIGGNPGPPSYWYHANCGGRIQIGDDAHFRCARCWLDSHIRHWRYACGNHNCDFRNTTSGHFASAVSMCAQLTDRVGKQWILRMLTHLDDW